jgi:hypothetical protein
MSNNIHVIRIIADACQAQVVPGCVVVHPGDTLEFVVLDEKEATIMIPQSEIVDFTDRIKDLNGENKYRVALPLLAEIPKGVYPYAVYVNGLFDFAAGHSSPKMIVD